MNLPDWWPHDKPYAIMDCLIGMKELPDKCVDLVLTDPPYNLGINYGELTDDNRDDYEDWFIEIVTESMRISNKVIITPGIKNIGLAYRVKPDWVGCWWKPASMGHCFVGACNWEPIFIWGKANNQICDVFRAPIVPDETAEGHPCPKPINLFIDIISKFSSEGDIILDPFLGSGTTLLACRKTNRIGLGFEINPEYEPIIRKRGMDEELINGKWHQKQKQQEWW